MRQTENAKRETGSNFFEKALNFFFPPKSSGTVVEAGQESTVQLKNTRSIVKRILYGVVALLIATLMWGYVLMNQNPDREKTFTNISLLFESGTESDLQTKKLTVYGDIDEVLKDVSVTVSAPLTEISKIRENNITATVSLNGIRQAGTYSVEVKATSTIGTVTSIVPDHIEITLDDVVSRNIPITYEFVGELPEAYWHDEPVLSASSTMLEGARTDLENVAGTVCYIDLDGITSSVKKSIQLAVLDNDQNVIDNSKFSSVIPSVNVNMTVLPHKHVNIIYEIVDRDQIPGIYEIQSETLSITSIDIAAEPEVLAQIETINAAPVSIGGIDETGEYKFTLALTNIPSGAILIDGVDRNNIQLTVVVNDKYVTQTLTGLPISFLNEISGYSYIYEFDTVDVTIYGPAKAVGGFVSSDIVISVNLLGRSPGEYSLPIEYKPVDIDSFSDIEVSFSQENMHVIISSSPSGE